MASNQSTSSVPRPAPTSGVLDRRIADTPIAVFDLETTGFPAGRHRIVELSICRIAPDGSPTLVFDSLINPGRAVTGGEIHGIDDRDVQDAPRFEDVAAEIVDALSGAVIGSYNVTFDIDFLCDELDRLGISGRPPHLCLMFLRPMLALGGRCSLEEACRQHGVEYRDTQCARADVEAAGELYRFYRGELGRQGLETFEDLAGRASYPFLESLGSEPLPRSEVFGLEPSGVARRRVVRSLTRSPASSQESLRRYWQAVSVALADLEISDVEVGLVRALRELLRLPEEQIRAVHARAFVNALVAFTGDDWLDEEEAAKTKALLQCLRTLGWAPGD